MSRRSHRSHADHAADAGHSERAHRGRGLGTFLRSLISGIPWCEAVQDEDVLELDAPVSGKLKIYNANGRTRVTGGDGDRIEVRIEKHARAETVEAAEELVAAIHVVPTAHDDHLLLEVEVPSKWNRHGHANLEVSVPRKICVGVTAANGKVCMEGIIGDVKARSGNGSLHVANVKGNISVTTSNAKVCCKDTCGSLMARSSNGKIELEHHRGSVDASTSNGVICAELESIGEEGVVLATSNGKIVLELPDDIDADVDIRVDNGMIRTERNLDTQTGDSRGRLRGKLGRGGTPIKLRNSNGTIALR